MLYPLSSSLYIQPPVPAVVVHPPDPHPHPNPSNHSHLTYAPHCTTIQLAVTVLTTNGPASPFPNFALPYTNHSSAKCPNAIPKVQRVISYTAGLSMW